MQPLASYPNPKKTKEQTKKKKPANKGVPDSNCKILCFWLLPNDYLTNCAKSHSLLNS